MKKTLQAKAKGKIQVSASYNIYEDCQRDNQLIYTSSAKAQKDPQPKKSKA